MDLGQLAQQLVEAHAKKTQHLQPMIRGISHPAYKQGVTDCLRAMQEAALADEPEQAARTPAISGPLGVQPNHAAQEGTDAVSE